MRKKIFLASPHMSDGGYEQEYVREAFDTNWVAPLGENVNCLEKEISSLVSDDVCAVATVSGTSAMHMALKALGVGEGDVVFCSSLTFAASCNPIVYLGATPVFIDSERKSWNMCPDALSKAFEKYPSPKAVICVNLYGQSCDYDRIKEICAKRNVPIVEDAAESLGATYKGLNCGGIGEMGILSFNGNKIITTSGGGMLLCKDENIRKTVLKWITQSREAERHYEHKEIGYNYRMSNICAGIGRGQLKVLSDRIKRKKEIYERYAEGFRNCDEIEMMPVCSFGEPNYWLSCMTLKTKNPVDIIVELEKENIESRPVWKPMHLQPVFENCDYFTAGEEDVCADIFKRGVCLPSDTKMTNEDVDRVIRIILNQLV